VNQAALNYMAMDESGLVACAKSGDREAFRAIMQRCNQRLFRVARALVGGDDEAEDVLQEAYLHAFAGISNFRGEAELLTWLTAIALNEARGRLRKRRPMLDLDIVDKTNIVQFPNAPADPEAEAGRTETRELLEAAIDSLPADFRIVFILRELEGCSVEETAIQLGINPATVKARLFRARRLMRASLERKFVTGLSGVFPFLGLRCASITEQVLSKLR
jgi:RNA polymerase sigma factor (sigma-70 family)